MVAAPTIPAMADFDHYLYQFRLIIIGASTVGKSCLLRRFTENRYIEHNDPTVGVDFHSKIVRVDSHNLKLQLWDTAGQERFRAITRSYFRNAVGALLVFNLTDRESFDQLPDWIDDVQQAAKPRLPVFILVGNKADMDRHRQVLRREAELFANKHNMDYLETSAKTGQNVDEVFTVIARRIYEGIQDGTIEVGSGWDGIKKGDEKPKELARVDLNNRRMSDVKQKESKCC